MSINNDKKAVAASFRDPQGFLFYHKNSLYRQINKSYQENYDLLMNSGLYEKLTKNKFLIPHEEVSIQTIQDPKVYKIIKPELIPFISYPYEWSFSQLKDAALLTMKIQNIALEYQMSLKDASAYNIQFLNGKPVFIDTLSFEKSNMQKPWVAYRQFCQHFLAPLALMSYTDIRLNQLLRVYIDGIPLDLASSLLPFKTKFNFSLLSNIHFHAKSQKSYAEKPIHGKERKISKLGFIGLMNNLTKVIKKLKWQPEGTEWAEYYDKTNYSDDSFKIKEKIVSDFLDKTKPKTLWDLGANIGIFSRIASNKGILTISYDIDYSAVEKNYLQVKETDEKNLLPLLFDAFNPSPAIGWENNERMSFIKRGPADTVMALALIHHFAISNNLPFIKISEFFASICQFLIIEFVPKNDSQVQKLLSSREDIFPFYDSQYFENDFKSNFNILDQKNIPGSERIIYLMKKK